MKTADVLLGNSQDLLNDFIEVLIQDVCGERTLVRCTRTEHVTDFVRQGSGREFALAILAPNNLVPDPDQPGVPNSIQEGVRAIRAIKSGHSTPVIVLVVFDQGRQEESLMLDAGADLVLELPFNRDELKSAVANLLKLPLASEHSLSKTWSLTRIVAPRSEALTET